MRCVLASQSKVFVFQYIEIESQDDSFTWLQEMHYPLINPLYIVRVVDVEAGHQLVFRWPHMDDPVAVAENWEEWTKVEANIRMGSFD